MVAVLLTVKEFVRQKMIRYADRRIGAGLPDGQLLAEGAGVVPRRVYAHERR